jgi:FKBP-type peptidyl-prolyl cis-trans isomerase
MFVVAADDADRPIYFRMLWTLWMHTGDSHSTLLLLTITEMTPGTGASPELTSTVEVHYHGTLTDGSVFDSSVDRGQTISFPLNGVIKGWQEGVALMKEGGKATLVVPSDLAYGDEGSGEVIPPGATLKFEVELFKVE